MARKIATVSTVFAACDRLDAANERWNREDVRNAIGGGGYVVIDPLIKAWRALKPLREAAPTTPAELLHQVATTLESHINSFTKETESRQSESQQVFDTTVSELSERLAAMEKALEEKESALGTLEADRSRLSEQLETVQQSLTDSKATNTQLLAENDGFRGQITRMTSEHKEAIRNLQADAKKQAQENAREQNRLSDEHATTLVNQRRELTEAAEHTENRLMVLLDQERQAAKESSAELTQQLSEMSGKAQSYREKTIALEATIRELNSQQLKLAADFSEATGERSQLSTALEDQKLRASRVEHEFETYKEKYKISGNLVAIQTAVAEMQAKLDARKNE